MSWHTLALRDRRARLKRIGGGGAGNTVPVITGVPTISGTPNVGQTLTATAATVDGTPTPTRTWQWYRGATPISGATSSTYTVASDDAGSNVSVEQIETNIAGVDSAVSTAVSVLLILNSLTALAGYSTRKLRAEATVAIRVRRSDNAETDIGFVGNDLDTAALLSFCGVGSGFMVTRYDQIGTNHQTQANPALQPRIVNAGVLETLNGKAAPNWTGNSIRMTHTPFDARHLAAVGNLSASAPSLSTLASSPTAAPTGQLRRAITQTDGWRAGPSASDYPSPTLTWIDGGVPTSIDQGGGVFALVDPLGSPRVWQFELNVLRKFDMVGNDSTGSRGFIGPLPELIYFATAPTTGQRQQLEADQGAYWGITINFP